ncbi:MAG: Ger(x)C family spore germination protein [Firmicutes bacterium]|nr:Ger(x)C family spore germination protein [Bacillota bacterium]
MKYIKKGLIVLMVCFLTGCWDDKEMEDRSYIITMGIDKSDDDNKYLLTLAPAQLSAMNSGEESSNSEAPEKGITVKGDSIASAVRQADTYSSRQVYLGQLKTVVLGKELLQQKQYLQSILDELERNQDISGKIILLGTEGSAQECVNAILEEDASTGLFIWDFYKNTAQDVAVTKKLDLETFLRELRQSKGNSILPKITTTEQGIKIGGGIALSDYAFIGDLTDKQQQGVLLLQEEGKGAVIEGIWQNNTVPMWVYKNKSKLYFTEENNQLICHIKLFIEGSAEGSNLESRNIFQSSSINEIENMFEIIIKSEIENTIALAQKKYKKDIFDIASELKKQNTELYQKYGNNANEMIQNTVFDVTVSVKIRTIGVVD